MALLHPYGYSHEMTDSADLDALAQRYIDMWQEQLAQISSDPAITEAWGSAFQNAADSLGQNLGQDLGQNIGITPDAIAATAAAFTAAFTAVGQGAARANQSADGPSSGTANGTAGAQATASTPDDGGADPAALLRRLDALEQRIAALQTDQGRDSG